MSSSFFSACRRAGVALTLLLICVFAGCSSSVGPTSGRVRFEDGEAVQSGSIEFRARDTGTRYASKISPDGRFEPKDEDQRVGLPPGEYEVVVVQIVLTEDLAASDHRHGRTVPRKYADYYTSGLRASVEPGDLDEIEILLAAE